jgi:hypothetical protein
MFRLRYPFDATPEEFRALMQTRRETLDAATARAFGGQVLPVSWRWGWKAAVKILKRDKDGSLCARITVTGPHASNGYVRNVRLLNRYRVHLNQR